MAEVVLEHLTKTYPNGVQAVRDLNLRIADGELVVLFGPSGCGKTTTLRLIAGLEESTAGKIAIGGKDVRARPPRDRDVAIVFQRSTLYPHLDVRRNLLMGLRMRRHCGPFARLFYRWLRPDRYTEVQQQDRVMADRVRSTAQLLGLEEILNQLPGQLSGGQQQRVALGRAIVRRPGVFLLDEPLSHLDGRLRSELRHELHLLQCRLRATMIYVTHDQAEAMTLADRVAVMDRGVVQQVDRPLVVYERPVNRFVAGFVGWPPMNFVDGCLLSGDGQLCFRSGTGSSAWSWELPPALCLPLQAACGGVPIDGAVTLGFRPEDIWLGSPPSPGPLPLSEGREGRARGHGGATLEMEVSLVESLGHARLVTLRRGDWQCLALAAKSGGAGSLDGSTLKQESMVTVGVDLQRAHLFDPSTGLALNCSRPAG